jgi:hypothetical protein
VYNEYLTSIPNGAVFDWATEAVARRFYQYCGVDGCSSNEELYDFLAYYSSARNERLDNDYQLILDNREFVANNPGFRPDIEANLQRLNQTVVAILDTPPISWTLGIGDAFPFGFGTAYCVQTDTTTLNAYRACGTATILQSNTDPIQPNGIIFFGTSLSTENQGVCSFRLCP